LETERLLLHKTDEKDLKKLWEILCIDDVSKYYLTTKINYDWEAEKKWQYKKLEEATNPDIFRWTIELKDTNEVIGQIDITEKSDLNDKEIRDIGRFIDPKFQRK
jgi:RimJ/RimL family protein N-acetyltransferase